MEQEEIGCILCSNKLQKHTWDIFLHWEAMDLGWKLYRDSDGNGYFVCPDCIRKQGEDPKKWTMPRDHNKD